MYAGCEDETEARPRWPQHHRAIGRVELFAAVLERLGCNVSRIDTAAASRTCLGCGHEPTCRLWLSSGAAGYPPDCPNRVRFARALQHAAAAAADAGHGGSAELPMDAAATHA